MLCAHSNGVDFEIWQRDIFNVAGFILNAWVPYNAEKPTIIWAANVNAFRILLSGGFQGCGSEIVEVTFKFTGARSELVWDVISSSEIKSALQDFQKDNRPDMYANRKCLLLE